MVANADRSWPLWTSLETSCHMRLKSLFVHLLPYVTAQYQGLFLLNHMEKVDHKEESFFLFYV